MVCSKTVVGLVAFWVTVYFSAVAIASGNPFIENHLKSLGPDSPSSDRYVIARPGKTTRPELNFQRRNVFPLPAQLRPRVNFWKKIYSVYTTGQVVIHDKKNLSIIYEVVNLKRKFKNPKPGSRAVRKYLKSRRRTISGILKKLYKNKGKAYTSQERAIAAKLSGIRGYKKYKSASRNVRWQLGQADKFKRGLRRSGLYLGQMRRIFRSHGLPEELTALPHVESSFNYKAYSSAGAAGIWQFMRRTGRLFMKINYTVDERRDPIISTHAAAKLLKQNYKRLRSWPLAITAYNHGTNGMARAKRRHGDNIVRIIESYRSRSFGFASKNFYAEFLAALDVASNYKYHFGAIDFLPERRQKEVTLSSYVSARTVAKRLGVSVSTLRSHNRALRKSVWKGNRRIPRGYKLKVPAQLEKKAQRALASLSVDEKFSSQKHSGYHIVRRGDTLSAVASFYRSSIGELKDANGLDSNLILVGQKLRIPGAIKSRRKRVASRPSSSISHKRMAKAVKGGSAFYYVKKGDTLSSIAKRHGVTVSALVKLNSLSRRSVIYPGQRLGMTVAAPQVKKVAYTKLIDVKSKEIKTGSKAAENRISKVENKIPKTTDKNELILLGGPNLFIRADHFDVRKTGRNLAELTVKPEETLGHYAEWAKVSVAKIRRLNKIPKSGQIHIGGRVKVPLSRVTDEQFERKRLEYYLQLYEDFFDVYSIEEANKVMVKNGQSLWELCVKENNAPLWLVTLYNPDMELGKLHPGDSITIPTIVKK
ncbi:Membrane-bound lytic murein transglycosylase D [hydrothermal vent metagenome]|uniref:Membrane-bound lytic murein transglycosylase D n=1 Tax=hydrothermal vent metagenome TaxID=652676 RepID=A0A3B1CUK1_9ZZZZ